VSVACCNFALGHASSEDLVEGGLVFERKDIANHSGDVKLVGDIDGDGRLDFVLGGLPQDPLSWWRGPDFHQTRIAPARVEFTTDGVLADVDGDNDLDVATADGPDGINLVWFENPRPNSEPTEGTNWKRHEIGAAGGWGKDIKAADFDGNGSLDIVVRAPDQVMIFFQAAPGDWSRAVLSPFKLGEEGMGIGDVDSDGDTDLVLQGEWAQNPGGAAARDPSSWKGHPIGPFDAAFKALVVDLDQDGRADILTSSSEHRGDVVWFKAVDGPMKRWGSEVIQSSVSGAHTLQAADMDKDGDIDVVVGQMHQTKERTLSIHYNIDGRGTHWARQTIDNTGLHNGVVADIDGDGDFDIYGANWAGHPPLRLWINQLDPISAIRRTDRWTYHRITDVHVRSFGLALADIDGDRRTDIVSGPFWYRQPGEPWGREWDQIRIGEGLDAIGVLDLDGDGRMEVFAQRGTAKTLRFVWLETKDAAANTFEEHLIGEVPRASHELGSQGHALSQIVKGKRPELAVSSGGGVYYFESTDDPADRPWLRTRICAEASDEGIAFADIDGDDMLDLVATTGDAKEVAWWRNPGDRLSAWERHNIAKVPHMVYPDRVAASDLDGDGRADVVVTEENGEADNAKAYWWHNPGDASLRWEQHEITSRGSLNSLAVSDLNNDGLPDLVTGEHRGALRTSIWSNRGSGRFVEQLLGSGFESHLGVRPIDLDRDGDLDLVSIAWDGAETIHVWRNDAVDNDSDHLN
jgi:hypothetical protein